MNKEKAIKILEEIIDEGWLISDLEKCVAIDACEMAIEALKQQNAIPIPDGATNGDVIKAMFPNLKIGVFRNEVDVEGLDTYSVFTRNWWDKPYEGGKEE